MSYEINKLLDSFSGFWGLKQAAIGSKIVEQAVRNYLRVIGLDIIAKRGSVSDLYMGLRHHAYGLVEYEPSKTYVHFERLMVNDIKRAIRSATRKETDDSGENTKANTA